MVMKAAKTRKELMIGAGDFKARCLQLLDDVKEQKLSVVITKRGVPCATLVPYVAPDEPFRSVFGRSPGGRIKGDLLVPLPEEDTTPGELWPE